MKERTLACWRCGHEPAPETFMAGIDRWWPWLDTARHVCPHCGLTEEIQVAKGRVVFGYLYAAATAHFAGMEEVSIPGLAVHRVPGALEISLGGSSWRVPEEVRASDR